MSGAGRVVSSAQCWVLVAPTDCSPPTTGVHRSLLQQQLLPADARGRVCLQGLLLPGLPGVWGWAHQPLPMVGKSPTHPLYLTVSPHSCAVLDMCVGSCWASVTCPSSVMGSHRTAPLTRSSRTGSPVPAGRHAATAGPVPPTRSSASSCWGQVEQGQGGVLGARQGC